MNDKSGNRYTMTLEQAWRFGYDSVPQYKPDIQKAVDKNPNTFLIRIIDLCPLCHTAYVIEEVDLRKDLIQIDHKLLLSNECQTCGHNKYEHELGLYPVHPEKFVQKTGMSFLWFIPFSYNYTDIVPDWEKMKPEDQHFTNCDKCGCDCYVPRPDDKVWALYELHKNGKHFPGERDYENSLTVMERLWLRKALA